MKRLFLVLCLVLILCGCAKETTEQYFMMDTVMTFTVYGERSEEACDAIADRIAALEKILSPTLAESELSKVNRAQGEIVVSDEFHSLLELSLAACAETDGAFDPTLGSVIRLWQEGVVPKPELLTAQTVGSIGIELNENSVLMNGSELNFGAVAKGYASDQAKQVLEEYQIERALLSLGGNIYAKGKKTDGSDWIIGVRDPDGSAQDSLGLLRASDEFIIASGDYERFFEVDGVRYHHIIDPKTRAPAQSDLRETVVISKNGTRGDVLSTALFVMGSEKAVEYWRENRDFDMILVCADKTLLVTSGIAERFTLTNDTYILEVLD